MSTSLFTGLSGLRAFESYLDVIGNNIANSNTIGFKGQRVTFGDLLSQTLASGTAPGALKGGTNPKQIGLGVGIKSIDTNTNSGSVLQTNRNLDLAIFGPGYFVVNNGQRDLYTRAGTFGFDSSGTLVDQGSGFQIKSVLGTSIVVPPNAISEPKATSSVQVKGNLPAAIKGPLEEILQTNAPFQTGSEATLSGSNAGPFALADGDQLSVEVDSGPPQLVHFLAADFTAIGATIGNATAAEVAQIINQQISGATASDNGGSLEILSDSIGNESKLKITDLTNNPAILFGISTALVSGTQAAAQGSTDLNDMVNTKVDYSVGDGIEVKGTLSDGTEFAATFVYGVTGTTLEHMRAFVDGLVTDGDVTLDPLGNLVMTADEPGEAAYTLEFEDTPGNATGAGDYSDHEFNAIQDGTAPDKVNSSIIVYDKNGGAHTLELVFERVDDSEWVMNVSLPDDDGIIIDGQVGDIRFGNDGLLLNAGGPGNADPNITIQFATGNQTIDLNLGKSGDINGITHFGGPGTAQGVDQDGYSAGSLADIVVSEGGAVTALYTNGQTESFGEIAIANFSNAAGLRREGLNMFSDSFNSGPAVITNGEASGATIQGGLLETSNVDLAEEFVRMIEAQRGYQASARVIRSSEELLQSLLQNI